MNKKSAIALFFGMLLCATSGFAQFNYVSIDVPNSTATWASGIGPGGQIVGGYIGNDKKEHGFLYSNQTFTTIDVPGSLVGLADDVKLEAEANGINSAGNVVGDYYAPPGAPGAPNCTVQYSAPCRKGFLLRHGQFSSVLVPPHLGSVPSSIAPDGTIYGCLHDLNMGMSMFGFIRTQSGDYRTFQYKTMESGGGELTNQVFPMSMNNAATPDGSIVVGLYVPPGASRAHGFKVQNGELTDYMFPGALATQIWGINPNGDFVGTYRNVLGFTGVHGFLQPADGSAPIAINYKDSAGVVAPQTQAFGISTGGAIVGLYFDSTGAQHGFLAVPVED